MLMAVANACMRTSLGCQAKEIAIMRHQHASLTPCKGQLLEVAGSSKPLFACGGHINVANPQGMSNRRVDMLIEVESHGGSHAGLASGAIA